MPVQTRTTLKTYFNTGDTPTEAQFIDLIDTLVIPSELPSVPVTSVAGETGAIAAGALRTAINVADGATANDADAALRARSSHTGTQAISTVTGLQTALDGKADLGANVFTGTQDFNGQQVEGMLNKVVASVSGTLTAADHSGNVLETSGNVTVPTTAGFNCVLVAGGAHTVTFNSTTSAAMAAGDLMTLIVEDATTIHAVLTAAADKVAFS